jgi:hypothetical protein
MYGRIGAALDGEITKTGFVADPAHPAGERSMLSLFMEDMIGTTEGMLEDVFYFPSAPIRRTFGFISAHRILLVVLAFSVIFNLFLSGRSTVSYWNHRAADAFMQKAGVTPNRAMVRMVSLQDIDELVTRGLNGVNVTDEGVWYLAVTSLLISISYSKFTEIYSLNDLADSNYDTAREYMAPSARQKAAELRASRQHLNVMRHELLVSLHSVNSVEKELVEGEWMTWLGDELYRCDRAARILANTSNEELEKHIQDIAKFRDYCRDCNKVWGNVKQRFTALS